MSSEQVRRKSLKGAILNAQLRGPDQFHLKRVECRLVLEEEGSLELHTRLLLNDFCLQGAALFSARPITPGSRAKLFLKEPQELSVTGQVSWSREFIQKTRVFTADPHPFRIGFSFELSDETQAAQIRAFCEGLAQVFPGVDLTRKPFAA